MRAANPTFFQTSIITTDGIAQAELVSQGEFFIDLYDHMPKELIFQRELLAARLS